MLVTQPYSKFTYAQKEWCTDSGANTGAQIVNTVNNRQSERSETLNFNNLNTNSLETWQPLGWSGNVSNETVNRQIVGDVGSTHIVEEFQVEELPGKLLEEQIVDSVGQTGQDLTQHCQEYQALPAVDIRPGTRQQGIDKSEQ